ncbi:MAG: PAS domain-containing protein, partial [Candidatus Moraniibacteriota bacterium]
MEESQEPREPQQAESTSSHLPHRNVMSYEEMEMAINNMPTPVFIKNERGEFLMVSDSFCDFVGQKREDIIGKSPSIFVTGTEIIAYEESDRLALDTNRRLA